MSIESSEVLIVDDSPTDAELTMHALRRNGASPSVTWLLSSEDVDHHFDQLSEPDAGQLPNLILMDVDLPGASGLRILERLKSEKRTRSIPVVMLSSRADDFTLRRCYDLGANSYVMKPVAAVEYVQAVSTLAHYWLTVNRQIDTGGALMLAHRRNRLCYPAEVAHLRP